MTKCITLTIRETDKINIKFPKTENDIDMSVIFGGKEFPVAGKA